MSWFDYIAQHEANVVEGNEIAWGKKCVDRSWLPKPKNEETIKNFQKYGIDYEECEDQPQYLVKVKLPQGWKISVGSYPNHRNVRLLDQQGTLKANCIVKIGGYDQFTSISFV